MKTSYANEQNIAPLSVEEEVMLATQSKKGINK